MTKQEQIQHLKHAKELSDWFGKWKLSDNLQAMINELSPALPIEKEVGQ